MIATIIAGLVLSTLLGILLCMSILAKPPVPIQHCEKCGTRVPFGNGRMTYRGGKLQRFCQACAPLLIAIAIAGCGRSDPPPPDKKTDDGPAEERVQPGTTDDGPAVERVSA